MTSVSRRTIQRLSLYRRILLQWQQRNYFHIYSYKLASLANITPARVRRDLMAVSGTGYTRKGYDVEVLLRNIGALIDPPDPVNIGLVGMGNLGKAVQAFLTSRRPNLKIVAVFDSDESKIGHVFQNCLCHHVDTIPGVVRDLGITIGAVAVPDSDAQTVVNLLTASGVRGIVNFAPASLKVPAGVYFEHVDITMAFERTAYLVRNQYNTGAAERQV